MNDARSGSLLDFIEDFTNRFPGCVDEYETLLTDNRIWKQRLVGIGVVDPDRAKALGFTGPMLRGSGVAWDLLQDATLRSLRSDGLLTCRSASMAIATTAIWCAWPRCAKATHHPPVRRMAAQQLRVRS